MDHRLVDGIRRLVRKDAGGETRHHLGHARLVARVEDVVVDQHVFPEKLQVCAHVGEQSSNLKQNQLLYKVHPPKLISK